MQVRCRNSELLNFSVQSRCNGAVNFLDSAVNVVSAVTRDKQETLTRRAVWQVMLSKQVNTATMASVKTDILPTLSNNHTNCISRTTVDTALLAV